ncbi:Hypp3507 [Branchiostoma lanceolatum]|uniref:Hypp3507 protein n=1 Tax=Branchiostoma lanceolatum TaxID=7740 RepID=A0A8K0A2D6_BRALA|nr:Hypp3507 [Branchiostoma lanceolatum]
MNTHIAIITETWFNADIPDAQWDINNYHLFSKPRQGRKGGGLAIYVKDNIYAKPLDITTPSDFECLWINIRPPRLPRELSSIAICAVYIPPNSPHSEAFTDHLSTVVDQLRSVSPDVGLCIAGDFNRTDVNDLCRGNQLQQVDLFGTKGARMFGTVEVTITSPAVQKKIFSGTRSDGRNFLHFDKERTPDINPLHTMTKEEMQNELTYRGTVTYTEAEKMTKKPLSDSLKHTFHGTKESLHFCTTNPIKVWMNYTYNT